jgi:hypothetical protein
MPDSIISCGDWNAPLERTTARLALTASVLPSRPNSMPLARLPSKRIWPRQVRLDIGARRAPALAVLLGDLIDAEAHLMRAVEVGVHRQLQLPTGFQKIALERIAGSDAGDIQRTAGAVEAILHHLVVLGFLEVGQHIVIGPAGVAERRPAIVVGAMAADIDHGVDRARSAQRLAAGLVADAAVQAGLRHRLKGPVIGFGRHLDGNPDRGLDHPIVAGAACLQQADADPGILAEAARHHTAGGSAADDDIVELFHVRPPCSLAFPLLEAFRRRAATRLTKDCRRGQPRRRASRQHGESTRAGALSR